MASVLREGYFKIPLNWQKESSHYKTVGRARGTGVNKNKELGKWMT